MGKQMVSITSYFCTIDGFMQKMRKNYSDSIIVFFFFLSNVTSYEIFKCFYCYAF